MLRKFKNIVVLTGSGISSESGIRTFRAADGLWEHHRIEDVATPEAFERNPELVHKFYNERRRQLQEPHIKPNLAHTALAELEKNWTGSFLLVTQNVDNLHERAGSKNLLHMHGELLKVRSLSNGHVQEWMTDLSIDKTPDLRPHIVWFGEMPFYMDEIYSTLDRDLFISIGTSGNVYPAAGFAHHATHAYKVEINLESTMISPHFDELLKGHASVEVPKFVQRIISAR